MGKRPKTLFRIFSFFKSLRWNVIFYLFDLLEVLYIASANKELPINEQIRVKRMMVIGPNGEQMGEKALEDALTLARYAGLDLVLMNETGSSAVAKIMDYNKYRYEKQKKMKEQQKKQRETNKELKEYRLSATIDIHDFETRVRNAKEYLLKGHKIKAFLRFKGRQMARPELGRDVLLKFADALSDVSVIETNPKLEGRQIFMLLAPKK